MSIGLNQVKYGWGEHPCIYYVITLREGVSKMMTFLNILINRIRPLRKHTYVHFSKGAIQKITSIQLFSHTDRMHIICYYVLLLLLFKEYEMFEN